MAYDPWVCRCGHEFTFEGIGTKNVRQIPHECIYDKILSHELEYRSEETENSPEEKRFPA